MTLVDMTSCMVDIYIERDWKVVEEVQLKYVITSYFRYRKAEKSVLNEWKIHIIPIFRLKDS